MMRDAVDVVMKTNLLEGHEMGYFGVSDCVESLSHDPEILSLEFFSH